MKLHVDFDAITDVLKTASDLGRNQLFENETYNVLSSLGAESVPRHFFLPRGQRLEGEELDVFPGDNVVLKVVSPYIIHKSDAGGVMVVPKTPGKVRSSCRRMVDDVVEKYSRILENQPGHAPDCYLGLKEARLRQAVSADIQGVLITQFMPPDSDSLGNELLVSLRLTREFGMIITAGLGGTDTELYAKRFRPGLAVVNASTAVTSGEEFFRIFRNTIGYEKLAGLTRGGKRLASDEQLLECFSAFISVGNHYSPLNPDAPFYIEELEVNPFAFVDYEMVPLDGLCRFTDPCSVPSRLDKSNIKSLLFPETAAIIGVSAKKANFGRLILQSILKSGFDPEKLRVVSPAAEKIDGVACVSGLSEMERTDLLVVAVGAEQALDIIDEVIEHKKADSVILIPSGFGETEGTQERAEIVMSRIREAQKKPGGPVFLGGNCMGMVSRPGKVDTFFVPEAIASRRRDLPPADTALISQSGAFTLARMMNLAPGDPAYNITMGNQTDLSIADMTEFMADLPDLGVIGIYAEGFKDLDGLYLSRAIKKASANGKEVIVYKAGRTPEGRKATSGHTSSVAGDYVVSVSCLEQAGALAAEDITEFEGLFNLASVLHKKRINGSRVAGATPAGYEAVGIADYLQGIDNSLELAELSPETIISLTDVFESGGLSEIMDIHTPLDVTPAADDLVHKKVLSLLLRDDNVDSVVISMATIAPATAVTPDKNAPEGFVAESDSFIRSLPGVFAESEKPIVIFNDAGRLHEPVNNWLKDKGIPVFSCCDQAVTLLSKYTAYRLRLKEMDNE